MLFFLFTAFPQATWAQDVLESIQFDTRWPDASPGNLAQADGSLFFAVGNVLVIFNETFTEQSRISLKAPRGITGIAADPSGDVLYAACGKGGLKIINTTDKKSPSLYASVENDGDGDPIEATALDLGATGTFVYLADNTFGLRIIDVSSPASPGFLDEYKQESRYTDEEGGEATVSGGYVNVRIGENEELAFILDQYLGLRILDISNIPTDISQLDQFDMRSSLYFGQLSEVVDLTIDGKYVYVSDGAYGIAILDYLSDQPQSETVVLEKEGQIKSAGSASGLCLSTEGDTLFLADGNAGLLVADISSPISADFDQTEDPEYPESLVKTESYAATGAYAIIENQGNVFLANAENGLAELQQNSGLIYAETGNFFDPPADATALTVEGDYAYVLDSGGAAEGLRIIELENEETGRSRLAGFVKTPGNAYAVAAGESYAWIADGTEGIASVDISDPDSPELLENQSFADPDDARDIEILEYEDGSVYAFIADGGGANPGLIIAKTDNQGGLSYIDWVSITDARAVAIYEETAEDGDVAARYALVANIDGLNVVDVTEPDNPGTAEFLDTSSGGGEALDVAARPPHAVVANGPAGILLADLSDPENPREIDSYDAEGKAEAVFIQQSYIHTAVGERGLLVIGISDTDPVELTPIDIDPDEDRDSPYYNTPGYAKDVAVAGNESKRYTYIADTHGGFLAFLHSDRIGEGINEQPFEESSDDTGCFIRALNIKH